jgi:DNA-binding transcriptional LysR family regulator
VAGHSAAQDLSLARLRVFAAVVDQGGYSAAARHLGLSQPTVSFHVQALERAFGAPLLTYQGRRVHPTAAGEVLYRTAVRTLRDAEECAELVAGLRVGRLGRVRVGASIAFEQSFFLTQVVAPFTRAHPDVEVSLRFGTSRQMVEAMRSREVDLAYVTHWHVPVDARYTPLHTSQVLFFVATGHPLAAQAAPTAEMVGAAGLVAAPLDTAEWQFYREALRAAGLRTYRVVLEVSGIQARILAAQAGLGVVAVFWPPFARRPGLRGLTPVRLAGGPAAGPEFGLVERGDGVDVPAVRAFGDWLRQVTAPARRPADAGRAAG